MPPRKKVTKVKPVEEVEAVEPVSRTRDSEPWPLPDDHYFITPVTSPRGRSGSTPQERGAISAIQQTVGVERTGQFDAATAIAVSAWREQHGLGRGILVDKATWEQMQAGEHE